MNCFGWLLDLYVDPVQGVVLWIITRTGKRLRLHQKLSVVFSAAGPSDELRAAWRWLRHQPIRVELSRAEGRDLFIPEPVTLLNIRADAAIQPRLFSQLAQAFPNLEYYDADIQLSLRHAAIFNTFPLCQCWVTYDTTGEVIDLHVVDSPWDLDPEPVPLRLLNLEPDVDPQHANPRSFLVYDDSDYSVELPLQDPVRLLSDLTDILTEKDPDVLVTNFGDTWLLPFLLQKSEEFGVTLPLNRDSQRSIVYKKEKSYFSYGVIIYNGQQIHLAGRLHLDRKNSFLLKDTDLEGVFESARVTALPIQTSARTSPGTGISSMQVLTALRHKILVPWHKQQVEEEKTARELVQYDQGGLVDQPIIGLHHNVAELDFISMYPSIMVRCNISPEKPRPTFLGSDEEPGLIPLTLKPLLDKRIAMKVALGEMLKSDSRYKRYQAASSAYKWLLVTCFGYLGYKNARFGRIESHESVTTWGREALLTAKEVAEEMGYTILHMYVDALWVQKTGISQSDQITPLLDAIADRTGLSIALDGIYNWIAFLSSKADSRVSVPNRYFGVFQDGSMKYRGIEIRRHDMPGIVVDTQRQMIRILAEARSNTQVNYAIWQAKHYLQKRITEMRRGQIPLEQFVISQRLTRELAAYKSPPPAARALKQLHQAGKDKRPGQKVKFIYTVTPDGVFAWDLLKKPAIELVDMKRYEILLTRAAATVMSPFTGITKS
jgi:DNA polymerase II